MRYILVELEDEQPDEEDACYLIAEVLAAGGIEESVTNWFNGYEYMLSEIEKYGLSEVMCAEVHKTELYQVDILA